VLQHGPDYDRLFPLFKIPVRSMAANIPDQRDWETIRAWAEQLSPKLMRMTRAAFSAEQFILAAD
jgi:hypothetical protein